MKEETKEILESLKPHNDIIKEYPLTLSVEEQKLLLDYITNLQDIIDKTIEYINKYYLDETGEFLYQQYCIHDDLLNILQGDDENETNS